MYYVHTGGECAVELPRLLQLLRQPHHLQRTQRPPAKDGGAELARALRQSHNLQQDVEGVS